MRGKDEEKNLAASMAQMHPVSVQIYPSRGFGRIYRKKRTIWLVSFLFWLEKLEESIEGITKGSWMVLKGLENLKESKRVHICDKEHCMREKRTSERLRKSIETLNSKGD